MKYPDNERILIVRPCLKAICLGVRSASKLLSVMLYRARNCKEDETTFTFTCTQADLVNDLCEELTTKQLHDMAIPVLQLLGYLDVNGSGFRHTYTVHLDKVQLALSCYKDSKKLEEVLISFIREELEEVPMELELVPIQLEEVLKQLELVLKTIGKTSNCKRGRKPRPQAALAATSENVDSNRDITDSITDKRESGAFAPADFLPSEDDFSEEDEPPPTVKMPAIKLNGATNGASSNELPGLSNYSADSGHSDNPATRVMSGQGQMALSVNTSEHTPGHQAQPSLLLDPEPAQADFPPAGSVASGAPTAQASGGRGKPEKPKRGRKQEVQLTLAEAQLKEWLEELRETEITLTKRTVTPLRSLATKKGADNKEMFLTIVAVLDSDPWFEEHKIGVDFYWIDRQWENKYIFLQRKKPPLADAKKPMDIYTAASLDKERNQQRIDKMKQKAAQQGHTRL